MTEFNNGDIVEINGNFRVVRTLESGRVLIQATQERQVAFPADYLGLVEKAVPVNPYLKACEGLLRPTVEVLVRDEDNEKWEKRHLYKIDAEQEYPFRTNAGIQWKRCIPFKGNERLEGTTDEYTGGEG